MDEDIDPNLPNPHLALFQSLGKMLREDPTAVTGRMSAWLSDEESPGFWAPFALSIRGLAYEVMDEIELARIDYVHALRMYDVLADELGDEAVQRLANNMKFMRVRLSALPPPVYPQAVFETFSPQQNVEAAVLAAPSPHPTTVAPPDEEDATGDKDATPKPTVQEPPPDEAGEGGEQDEPSGDPIPDPVPDPTSNLPVDPSVDPSVDDPTSANQADLGQTDQSPNIPSLDPPVTTEGDGADDGDDGDGDGDGGPPPDKEESPDGGATGETGEGLDGGPPDPEAIDAHDPPANQGTDETNPFE